MSDVVNKIENAIGLSQLDGIKDMSLNLISKGCNAIPFQVHTVHPAWGTRFAQHCAALPAAGAHAVGVWGCHAADRHRATSSRH
jgi:hypothetical protein